MQVQGSACVSATTSFVKMHFICTGGLVCLYPNFRFGSVNFQNKGDRTRVRGVVISELILLSLPLPHHP